jgi:hypothetical protein
MPGMQFIKPMGWAKFLSHGLKLPAKWKDPSGDPAAKHYGDALGYRTEDKIAVPKLIPPFFMPHNMNKFHQQSADEVGQIYKDIHDGCLDAIGFAHNMWKMQAKFKDLKNMEVSAIGAPGCLDGPELESNIKNAPMVASWTDGKAKHRDAIAKGVSKCFKDWQSMVTVPGLPWYPAFAAFPGPMAPPTPNVPTPLITCVSAQMPAMAAPMSMKSEMDNALDGGIKNDDPEKQYEALHDAIATVVSAAFMIWVSSQMVMNVLGKGPIPTFAPPYVPVGPVVGGDNLPIPGHLMA